MKTHLVYFVLSQFCPKNAMSQAHPVLYNIDYSGSYRPFLFRKLQLIKIKNNYMYHCTTNRHHYITTNTNVICDSTLIGYTLEWLLPYFISRKYHDLFCLHRNQWICYFLTFLDDVTYQGTIRMRFSSSFLGQRQYIVAIVCNSTNCIRINL